MAPAAASAANGNGVIADPLDLGGSGLAPASANAHSLDAGRTRAGCLHATSVADRDVAAIAAAARFATDAHVDRRGYYGFRSPANAAAAADAVGVNPRTPVTDGGDRRGRIA
jgi:hypothetical protein